MSTNFSEMCRFCMGRETNMSHLYLEENNIIEKVLAFVPVLKILAGDGLPEQACSRCIYRINDCYSFKKLCEESDKSLRQLHTQKLQAETRVGESDEMKKVERAGNFFVVKVEDVKEELIIEDSDEFGLNNTDTSIDESQHNSAPSDDRTFVAASLKQDQEQNQNQAFVVEERLQPCSSSTNSNFKKDTLTQPFIYDPLQDSPCSASVKVTPTSSYVRKSSRKLVFTKEILEEARKRIANGESQRKVAIALGSNESTLRRRLKTGTVPTSLGRHKPIFSPEVERELAEHLKELDRRFNGITRKQLMKMAFEFAELNNIDHRFNRKTKLAGKNWVSDFCRRQGMTPCVAEKCSSVKAPVSVSLQMRQFFKNLETVYKEKNFPAYRKFNMDELEISTIPNHEPDSCREEKILGKFSFKERSQTLTVVCSMNPTGMLVPPAIIFPSKTIKSELYEGTQTGTLVMVSDSGFITSELFVKWLRHFQNFVKSNEDDPVLLILDNHLSHCSLEAIMFCRKHYITLLSLPYQASHKFLPLDAGLFSPVKKLYAAEVNKWLVANPGEVITEFDASKIFTLVYEKFSNIKKCRHAFKVTGIHPLNPNAVDK